MCVRDRCERERGGGKGKRWDLGAKSGVGMDRLLDM